MRTHSPTQPRWTRPRARAFRLRCPIHRKRESHHRVTFEAFGVEPVFPKKGQAIDYAQNRACFRSGEIRVLDCEGAVQHRIPFSETDRKL